MTGDLGKLAVVHPNCALFSFVNCTQMPHALVAQLEASPTYSTDRIIGLERQDIGDAKPGFYKLPFLGSIRNPGRVMTTSSFHIETYTQDLHQVNYAYPVSNELKIDIVGLAGTKVLPSANLAGVTTDVLFMFIPYQGNFQATRLT